VIADGAIDALERCPEPWCSCALAAGTKYPPTKSDGWMAAHLTCNRFRRELMLNQPNLVDAVTGADRLWIALRVCVLRKLEAHQAVHVHRDIPSEHLGSKLSRQQVITVAQQYFPIAWAEQRAKLLASQQLPVGLTIPDVPPESEAQVFERSMHAMLDEVHDQLHHTDSPRSQSHANY